MSLRLLHQAVVLQLYDTEQTMRLTASARAALAPNLPEPEQAEEPFIFEPTRTGPCDTDLVVRQALREAQPITGNDLARLICMPFTTMRSALQRLEELGMIERVGSRNRNGRWIVVQ